MPFELRSITFWEIPSITEKVGSKERMGQPKLVGLSTGSQGDQKGRVQPPSVSTVGPRQLSGSLGLAKTQSAEHCRHIQELEKLSWEKAS